MQQKKYAEQVDARAQQMLEALLKRGTYNSMWAVHVLMALAPDDEKILAIMRQGLKGEAHGPLGMLTAGPFQILPCMLLYCRWEKQLPAAARQLIKQFMPRSMLERGNTENHWLMYYTGNLLAAERWPDEEVAWNGLPMESLRREARRWILGTIERTARLGHHEYDSTGYHIEHMAALIGLREYSRDAHLREQVDKVLTLLVADMALEYFYGAWAGGHSREGYRQNTWTRIGAIQSLQYLYFGGEDFDPECHLHGFAIPALVSAYRPPALFARMAWDRQYPFIVRKTKAPRSSIRHVDRKAEPVRKYTYLSPNFALGSTQLGLPGAPAGPIDLTAWDLTWRGPRHQAKICCNHPYRDPRRFSAFLAEPAPGYRPQRRTGKPYLQFPDRLFGASPYEQMMQHKGTLVVLYRIPEDDDAPYVNLFLPQGTTWTERGGWILGNMGDFYTGLYPIGEYQWTDICEASNANLMVREGDLIDGSLLRIEDRFAGLVLKAVEAEEAGSFAAFCAHRPAAPVDLSDWPHPGRVALETLSGTCLEMVYDGVHCIDGETIDYTAYPLYGAPGAAAEPDTGRMLFSYGNERVELDFGIDPQQTLLPMRVIG